MAAMTTERAFVWVWLPGATEPIVAGRLDVVGDQLAFTYGRSYLARPGAISLFTPELPLGVGRRLPPPDRETFGCVRDAAPDAWGQRVILSRLAGPLTRDSDTGSLPMLTYLLQAQSNRIGGLDFQASSTEYVPRQAAATLDDMLRAADRLQAGEALPAELEPALLHGTSIGGARPKATLVDGGRELIAKFSSTTDPYPVVKAEAAAMELARRVGLNVPASELVRVLGRDVLLVQRFDRTPVPGQRRLMVSALTVLGLTEMTGRYASYPELADELRKWAPTGAVYDALRELFSRVVFNVCVGNIDDHARNHAMFWDGEHLELTPAYDLSPQLRSGGQAAQAMAISRDGAKESRLSVCLDAADEYGISRDQARGIVENQVMIIDQDWDEVADAVGLSRAQSDLMRLGPGAQILNPFIHGDG
jgi:serine/threonine-protein kinase HipA